MDLDNPSGRESRRIAIPDNRERSGNSKLAFVRRHKRLVVGDEFGEQRQDKEDQENPQRPISALVMPEIGEPPPIERATGGSTRLNSAAARGEIRSSWRRSTPARSFLNLPRLEIDARIDPGIGQVGNQIHHEAEQGENVDIGEDDWVIAVDDRFVRE